MKNKQLNSILFVLTLLLALSLTNIGWSIPSPMQPSRMVNDFANLFTLQERDTLESQVRGYERETTTQIYIITVTSTEGMQSLEYATAIGNSWGIGQKGKNNGIVLLIVPSDIPGQSKVAVALGSGTEKVISNTTAQDIVDNTLVPLFKKKLYAEGVSQTVHTFGLLLKDAFSGLLPTKIANKDMKTVPETVANTPSDSVKKEDTFFTWILWAVGVVGGVIALLIIALAIFAKLGGRTLLELLKTLK